MFTFSPLESLSKIYSTEKRSPLRSPFTTLSLHIATYLQVFTLLHHVSLVGYHCILSAVTILFSLFIRCRVTILLLFSLRRVGVLYKIICLPILRLLLKHIFITLLSFQSTQRRHHRTPPSPF